LRDPQVFTAFGTCRRSAWVWVTIHKGAFLGPLERFLGHLLELPEPLLGNLWGRVGGSAKPHGSCLAPRVPNVTSGPTFFPLLHPQRRLAWEIRGYGVRALWESLSMSTEDYMETSWD
jgi:hypothetical protein